jgi:hypothetical protein
MSDKAAIDPTQLLRDVDECFDWLVRGSGGCECGDCRMCFSHEVAERLMSYVKDLPKPEPRKVLEIGFIVDDPAHGKYKIFTQEQLDKANKEDHIFVCEKAHEDGSFAYMCGGSYCRCCQ